MSATRAVRYSFTASVVREEPRETQVEEVEEAVAVVGGGMREEFSIIPI